MTRMQILLFHRAIAGQICNPEIRFLCSAHNVTYSHFIVNDPMKFNTVL